MSTLFDGFFQLGFVARDLDCAIDRLGRTHGITHFRRKQASSSMWSAHAWSGATMIEVLMISEEGPDIYNDYIPSNPEAITLHHHGYRIFDEMSWRSVEKQIDANGFDKPMYGSAMNGDLNYIYADTRGSIGIYSEFIYLTGSALSIYDDVPRN